MSPWPEEPHKTCATCANALYKTNTEPCKTCIDEGDSKIAPHYSRYTPRES